MEKFVQIENVKMSFETKRGEFVALRDVYLNIKQGEFVSIIGHSGCGKSTLLNLIAGLTPSVGSVRPAIKFSNVDLPHPEWPMMETNSPCLMFK